MEVTSLIIEIICFLASLALFWQASVPKYLKAFPFFLLITLGVEFANKLFVKTDHSAALLYNTFTTFEIIFYLYIIRCCIYNLRIKTIILWIMVIYPVLVIINSAFFQVKTFHTSTYSFGCLLVVGACIYYFLELFQSTYSVNLAREPAFWVCSGLLFFYTCTFPLMGLWNHLHGLPSIILRNLFAVLQILNVLLYSLFSIAFLCRIRFRKVNTAL
ncbi:MULTISPECIES: hypothetical protein [Niastella]|uniref:Uncharacterized protein n=1 Tax=Niastella soli TaxID=2821487 RepID=A0ABS3YMX9_9BACT|nr:hypothetical protein [Niastella soli]MBO9199232.1 hypothetical protein [Niastella soli]